MVIFHSYVSLPEGRNLLVSRVFFFPVQIQTDACPYVDAEKTESIKMYQGSEGTNNSNININIH